MQTMQPMLSHSAVVNELSPVIPGAAAARFAAATFCSSGGYTHIRKRLERSRTASGPLTRSTWPEMDAAADGEEPSLHRLLLDEVESVNRLYKVVSQAGCEILFYGETGQLTGRYGKSEFEGHHMPAPARGTATTSPRDSPIFNADGSFVGSLDVTSAGGECTGTAAALMQMLVRSTAHAVEERAFRKRYAGDWIVALVPPDGETFGALLAVDRSHRVVGADRRARTILLTGERDAPAITFWSLFEKNPAIFACSHDGDRPVALTRLGAAEPWPALITPPAPDLARTPAQLDLHARPRLDIVGCFPSRPAFGAARGGLTPRALRCVREYIDGRLAENIRLDVLAGVAGLSRCHFARAFKQSVGIAPHAYVMQRRLERAERLLAETDLSLSQVALDSGFSDQSHFSSCFRKHFGTSPRSFRRSRR
jgi:AraC-like DNA-binding protein